MAKGSDVLTRLKGITYLGSHPGKPGQQDKVDVTFFTHGVQADRGRITLMSQRWSEIHDLRAEDREGIERRITAGRLLLVGGWAFVFPRKRGVSYLSVADSGGEWIFSISGLSAMELSSGLRPLQSRIQHRMAEPPTPEPALAPPVAPLSVAPSAPDAAERLQALQGLLDAGLIQADEFAAKRQEIIDSL